MGALVLLARAVAAIAVALVASAALVAGTHWAVRRRYLDPFGAWSRGVRRLSDPVLRPIESQIMRRGGNPQDGTLWLVGIAVAAGLLLIALTRWLVQIALTIVGLGSATPLGAVKILASAAIAVVMTAILVRVIAQWLAVSPYSKAIRLVHRLTDWIVLPIRKRIPPLGIIDLSPLLAYFALFLLRELVWALPG